jgi:hypothetical protein
MTLLQSPVLIRMGGQPDVWVQQEINQTAKYSYSFKVEQVEAPKVSPY